MKKALREQRVRRRTLYQGRIVELFADEVRLPNGRPAQREVVGHRPAAAVVPLLPDGRVVLVRQFRYAVGKALWELPAGLLDPGETPRQGAARELREETGYRARKLKLLVKIYTSPGFCTELIHLFLAQDLADTGVQKLDEDELLTAKAWPFAQALAMIRNGTIVDAKTALALNWVAAEQGIR